MPIHLNIASGIFLFSRFLNLDQTRSTVLYFSMPNATPTASQAEPPSAQAFSSPDLLRVG